MDSSKFIDHMEEGQPFETEEEFMEALDQGQIIIERSDLTRDEILLMRKHYGRGGYSLRKPVEDRGASGGLVWLGFNDDGSARLPRLPAIERAEAAGVRLRKADVWISDLKTGEIDCYTVFSTFRRASIRAKKSS